MRISAGVGQVEGQDVHHVDRQVHQAAVGADRIHQQLEQAILALKRLAHLLVGDGAQVVHIHPGVGQANSRFGGRQSGQGEGQDEAQDQRCDFLH